MKHILFTILFASSLLAATQSALEQAQERILAMSVEDAKMELQDNFSRATEEQLSEIFDESVLNWQPSDADVKAAMGGDWAQYKKIFACPTSKSPDFYPMLYNVDFKAGASPQFWALVASLKTG